MASRRLLTPIRAVFEVAGDLLLRRYPAFVTGGGLPAGDIPVFVFHSLEPETFSRQLRHLRDNRYATLASDEYLAIIQGRQPAPPRAVVLTFDDARGSLWSVGAPLLRRFGMRGVVFVVPSRLTEASGDPLPTWDAVTAGRVPRSEVLDRERGEAAFLHWKEIEILAREGVFDFQSHTLTHARIATSQHIEGFVTPSSRLGYDAMDLPLVHDGTIDLLGIDVPLGTPILRSAPRTSEALRFFEEPATRRSCAELVAALGGVSFFQRRDWHRRLRRAASCSPVRGRLETPPERSEALLRELGGARSVLEERLGSKVHHLCFPWHASGPTAMRLAREVGYQTAFCGKVKGVPLTRVGGDPWTIARVSGDFLERLPGEGRVSLAAVLRRKWTRRLASRA